MADLPHPPLVSYPAYGFLVTILPRSSQGFITVLLSILISCYLLRHKASLQTLKYEKLILQQPLFCRFLAQTVRIKIKFPRIISEKYLVRN